jgi:glycosyltransferase involved in cell wall biosynthesis
MSKVYEITHVTTVHPRYDTRIFNKMCTDLTESGFKVSLFTTDGLESEVKNGVSVVNLDRKRSMIPRLIISHFLVFIKILKNRKAIYHFHDPELLIMGIILSLLKFKVVLDFHEDTGKQIEQKHYINPKFRKLISSGYKLVERIAAKISSGLVFATPAIAKSIGEKINSQSVIVNNYVKISEFQSNQDSSTFSKKNIRTFCYIGLISFDRCFKELLDSLSYLENDFKLVLAGNFASDAEKQFFHAHKNFEKVIYKGHVNREEFKSICQDSICGMLLFKPVGNHIESQPNKMWEYLVCNTRLVATNFDYWKTLLSPFEKFIQYSDNSAASIAQAVKEHALEVENDTLEDYIDCSNNITKRYSWEAELKKLISFYKKVYL